MRPPTTPYKIRKIEVAENEALLPPKGTNKGNKGLLARGEGVVRHLPLENQDIV
jgi:hypothetical protein